MSINRTTFPRKRGPIRHDLSIWVLKVDASRNNVRLWLWVPAFAGTTLKLFWRLAGNECVA